MICCCLAAKAQKMPVVADMDTRVPSGCRCKHQQRAACCYRLYRTLSYAVAFQQRNGFEEALYATPRERYRTTARHIVPYSARGGAYDVVVTAPEMSFDMKKAIQKEMEVARLPKPSEGFNLLGLFQLIMPKAKTQSRADKIKKILDKY